ncbi:signal peptidase II [bacterium]|nr:signal peptidase II [bacterium]
MSKNSKILYLLITSVFFIVFDLFFSELILNDLRFKIESNPIMDLIFVQNTGAAFSILENFQIFLIIFSFLAIAYIFVYAVKNIERFSLFVNFWLALLIAGVSCNLYERIAFGYVRDFFKLNFIDFPVFNISDIFINVSVIALICIIIKNRAK